MSGLVLITTSPAVCVHCEAEAVATVDQTSRHLFEVGFCP
jgi:hypothetical protein